MIDLVPDIQAIKLSAMRLLVKSSLFVNISILLFISSAAGYGNFKVISKTTPKQTGTTTTFKPQAVELFMAGDYIMLECSLNGKPAYFLIDTGASYTVLHSKAAKSYGFQVIERKGQQTTGFGGNQSLVQIAIGTSLQLGDQEVSMGFLAQDLNKIIRLVQNESKLRIAGIIGSDLLKRYGCSLDIGNKRLHTAYGS